MCVCGSVLEASVFTRRFTRRAPSSEGHVPHMGSVRTGQMCVCVGEGGASLVPFSPTSLFFFSFLPPKYWKRERNVWE